MIQGNVNARHEATVLLPIRDGSGRTRDVEFIVDTGFSGAISLPSVLILNCQMTWQGREQATLADGNLGLFDLYAAEIVWDGVPRVVETLALDAEPLLGMELLAGHELTMEVRDAGIVAIRQLP